MTYWEYKASLDKYGTYTRGQVMDAYETAEYATIDRVLKIIDEEDQNRRNELGVILDSGSITVADRIRNRVLALKGG